MERFGPYVARSSTTTSKGDPPISPGSTPHNFLKGLLEFIQPMIKPNGRVLQHDANAVNHACNTSEGKNLIAALEDFVGLLLRSSKECMDEEFNSYNDETLEQAIKVEYETRTPDGPGDEDEKLPRDSKAMSPRFLVLGTTVHGLEPPSEIAVPMQNDLPSIVIQQIYQHVFNNMPIRLLVFNSEGSSLRLLERSAIAEVIMSRIPRDKLQALDKVKEDYKKETLEIVQQSSSYAILSHTWIRGTPGDVVFGDWTRRASNPRGNAKIVRFCEVAARDHGLCFGWMDTVCINKESSTELDESIRSMYRWYKLSAVCISYLAETSAIEHMYLDSWFTRGWTLQELLAPQHTVFHDKDWSPMTPSTSIESYSPTEFNSELTYVMKDTLSTRNLGAFLSGDGFEVFNEIPLDLQYQIYKATSITRSELLASRLSQKVMPISRIIQLATRRNVTREEDKVYSLMGLLQVGITVAYGEGERSAFARLIREIATTKPAFGDIINHGNPVIIVPTTISDFITRSSVFDLTSIGKPPGLFYMRPIQPMLLTHMGIQLPILLVPVFSKDKYQDKIPKSSKSETIIMLQGMAMVHTAAEFMLLDRTEPSASWIYRLGEVETRHIAFIGIVNFHQTGNNYCVRDDWFYIPMRIHRYPETIDPVRKDIKPSELVCASGTATLSIPGDRNEISLPEEKLRRLGIQIVTVIVQ